MSVVIAGKMTKTHTNTKTKTKCFNVLNFEKTSLHQVSVAVAGVLPVLAFLAIPQVEQLADQDFAADEAEKEIELCLTDDDSGDRAVMAESSFGASQVAALSLFLLWKLMMGVAITTYWTLGVAYMVDAISPLAVPAALGKVGRI